MINIRPATSNDVDTLYNLIQAIAKFHGQERFVLTSKEEMLESAFGRSPKFGALIAEYKGDPAGYLSYTWNYSIWKGSEYMNMDDLFVLHQYRGQKIGYNLMQSAKELCQRRGIPLIRWEVEKDNTEAIQFYKRLEITPSIKGIFRWNL